MTGSSTHGASIIGSVSDEIAPSVVSTRGDSANAPRRDAPASSALPMPSASATPQQPPEPDREQQRPPQPLGHPARQPEHVTGQEERTVREQVAVGLVLGLAERQVAAPQVGRAGQKPQRVGGQVELGVRVRSARATGRRSAAAPPPRPPTASGGTAARRTANSRSRADASSGRRTPPGSTPRRRIARLTGGLVSCCTISVTPKTAAAPSSSPTTMLAAAGTRNRSMRAKLACAAAGAGALPLVFGVMSPSRVACALLALPALLLACSPSTETPAGGGSGAASASSTATSATHAKNADPAAPACGDGQALLAAMSTRDKLAQLLMVGVTGADDARAVVDEQHVGGIFIGSWTDLSMLTDGSLAAVAASAGPLPLAVQRGRGGRSGVAPGRPDRHPARRRGCWPHTKTPDQVYSIALAARPGDAGPGHHRRLRAGRRRDRRSPTTR